MKHWNLRIQKQENASELIVDVQSYEFMKYTDSNGETGIVLRLEFEEPGSDLIRHIDLELDDQEAQMFLDSLVEAMTEL